MFSGKFLIVGAVLALSAIATPAPAATPESSATRQLQDILTKLHESGASQDWPGYRDGTIRLEKLFNGSPPSLLELARADVHAGDSRAALGRLDQIAHMEQSYDLHAISTEFDDLLKEPGYAKVENGMAANRETISRASTAIELSDPDLLAEDVDHDPVTRRFFVTSIRGKKIIAVTSSGKSSTFARSPDGWPMFGVAVDADHGVVWATEVAMQGFRFTPESAWGRSAVLCYNLRNGQLLRRIEGPAGSALGDMVLAGSGDVIVSDSKGGGIYRVSKNGEQLVRLDQGQFISPQTPAMAPDGKSLFVPDYQRGIGVLDLASKQVRWLSMKGKYALNGIDGLYFHDGQLIAVQNGASPERVVTFTLDPSFTGIEAEQIVERSTPTLGTPTHGVTIAGDFYYIANSGWDVIDGQGKLKSGAKPSPARIMRFRLRHQ